MKFSTYKVALGAMMLLCLIVCNIKTQAAISGSAYNPNSTKTYTDNTGVIWYYNIDTNSSAHAEIIGWEIPENIFQSNPNVGLNVPANVNNNGQLVKFTKISQAGMTQDEVTNSKATYLSFTQGCMAEMAANCFDEAKELNSIDLTNYSGTFIPDFCFDGTNNVEKIVFNSKLTSIGKNSFENCGLKDLDLSATQVHTIGDNAFGGCSKLKTVKFPSTLSTLDGTKTFRYCGELEKVDFSNTKVKKIPTECFRLCPKLHTVVFSPELEVLGSSSFRQSSGLKEITLPSTLKTIENNTFYETSSLSKITFEGKVPPESFGTQILIRTSPDLKIYVPVDASKAYKTVLDKKEITYGNGSNRASVTTYEKVKISQYGYISYYLANENFEVPTGCTAYVVTGQKRKDGGRVAIIEKFTEGKSVPAATGFVVEALNSKSQILEYRAHIENNQSLIGESLMKGTGDNPTTYSGEEGEYFVLSPDPETKTRVGFYYQKNTGGKQMTLQPHQAGLLIAKGTVMNAKSLVFGTDEFYDSIATGIDQIENDVRVNPINTVVYDLQGRRVKTPKQGIYIMNGKKVIFK